MQGTYTLTEDDAITAHRLYFRTYMFSRAGLQQTCSFLLWPIAFGVGSGAFLAHRNRADTTETILIIAGITLFFCVLVGLWMAFSYRRYRRAGREYLYLGGMSGTEIRWRVTEHGHEAETAHLQSRYAWTDYQGWSEDKDVFLLYIAPAQFQIKPKRAIAATDIDAMRSWLMAAGIKQMGPFR